MYLRCVVLLVLVLLAGCGKPADQPDAAPTAPSSAPANTPAAKPDRRPVIAAFGDSLTAGHGLDAGLSYPDVLQKMLDEKGYKYRIVNLGISGDTTSGGVSRMEAAVDLQPEIVILELGANDGLRGLPVENTRQNLTEMVNAFTAAGARVLLAGITLPRNYGADYIRDFDAIYSDLAKQKRLAYLPFLLEGVALNRDLMQRDGLHPNERGTRVVAGNVFRALEPLLKKPVAQ